MIKKTIIFYNSKRKSAVELTEKTIKFLNSKKIETTKICVNEFCPENINADLALTIGGDGTVLYSARKIIDKNIPLISVNVGGLGFLSSIEPNDVENFLEDYFNDKYKIIERVLLEININKKENTYLALNECVIRAYEARAFHLKVHYGQQFLSSYFGDGLIISTPTGSTAYNLAAMGPILMPETQGFSLTPICPHTLSHRPMILSDKEELKIYLLDKNESRLNIAVSIDGQENIQVETGDFLSVKKHNKKLKNIVPLNFSYFDVLRTKLNWGNRK